VRGIRRGLIHWARLDKRRPVVIVSNDVRNEHAGDVLVVPCSTVRRLGTFHVPLRAREGGLPSPSVAKCEQVVVIEKALVDPAPLGGPLSVARLDEIERALLFALGFTPRSLERHLAWFRGDEG
jgi:mRNA interferase MazF